LALAWCSFDEGLSLASRLEFGADFTVDKRERRVELTDRGTKRLVVLAEPLQQVRFHFWCPGEKCGLSAQHLFIRDKHYLLREGQVQIIDESTGRVMAGRTWERGLQQMIPAKEGVEISARRDPRPNQLPAPFPAISTDFGHVRDDSRGGVELWSV
jgi:preprotein translocase subunit SecA